LSIDYYQNIETKEGLQVVAWLADELQIIRQEEGLSPNRIANMMCLVVNL
jgi:hypothetical protein